MTASDASAVGTPPEAHPETRPETHPETRAELVASRARLVAAAEEDRRRLQRELHDGAQQRLVHALIVLTLARDALEPGSPAADLVAEARTNVEQATRDLRAVVHAMLPRSLTHGGLPTGLRSLVDDLPVPVALAVEVPRLPAEVETTAYLVVAGVLRAVVAPGHGERIAVDVRLQAGALAVEVRYAGPASLPRGHGEPLTAVRDRVRAAGGTLELTDHADGSTVVRARLPTTSPAA